MDLKSKHCVPCEGGVPKLSAEEADRLLAQVEGWERRGDRIAKTARFEDFAAAMKFVNRMADVAEAEGHHPDFTVHYNEVSIEIWTHAIGGLSENDFILAARIDSLG